jgi:hypothetical protein
MTDGGIQEGLTVWATININGANGTMTKEALKDVMDRIKAILDPVDGRVAHAVKISRDDDVETPTISIGMKKAKDG